MAIQDIGYTDFVDLDSDSPARLFVAALPGRIRVSMYVEEDGDFEFVLGADAAAEIVGLLGRAIVTARGERPTPGPSDDSRAGEPESP